LSDTASHPDAMRRASFNELPAGDGVPSGDVGLRGCSSAGSGARGGRSGLPIPVPVPADDLPAASDAVPAHPGCLSAAAPGDAVPAHPLPAPDTVPADSGGLSATTADEFPDHGMPTSDAVPADSGRLSATRSEEHTSELQ